MYKKILLRLFLAAFCFLVCSSPLLAQKRYLLKGGSGSTEVIPMQKGEKTIDAIERLEGKRAVIASPVGKVPQRRQSVSSALGLIDTLGWTVYTSSNFTNGHQEVMADWFATDAGGNLKEFWFYQGGSSNTNNLATVRIFNSNIGPTTDAAGSFVDAGGQMGWYLDADDGDGNVTPYKEEASDPAWVTPNNPAPPAGSTIIFDPLGDEIWLPGGLQIATVKSAWNGIFLGDWFVEPTFNPGVPFIPCVKSDETHAEDPGNATSFLFGRRTDIGPPYHGMKFYEHPGTSGNPGWHIRTSTWTFYFVVEFTTDRAPVVQTLTVLPTTLSTAPRTVTATVTDDNPSGGPAGVASVDLHYSVDGGPDNVVAMSNVAGDDYAGDIPGGSAGQVIAYYVVATDVQGNPTTSGSVTYNIFAKSAGSQFLLALNGLSEKGYPGEYYFYDIFNYGGMDYNYDIWAFGPLTAELLNAYNTVIEVTSNAGERTYVAEVKAWLDAGGKNYILAGDEVVGLHYGWPGTPVNIPEGTNPADAFFDYLGLDVYYGDINYAASGDQRKAWPITAVPGDAIAGEMADTLAARGDTLSYHPDFEIGVANWLDGFDVDGTVTTAFTADANPGAGYGALTLDCGFYKHDATLNNNVAFFAFDPLSLHAKPNTPNYYWYSATRFGPLTKALVWMGVVVGVERDPLAGIPEKFALAQNYPNPFNPSTKIEYSIPENSFVTLKVFNVLGQEVATLMNGEQDAGKYIAEFNSTKLSSGVYIYKLQAGNFAETKKMMLVK